MSHPHRPGSPRCRELFERLSEYLDGELESGICAETETHLEDCPPCRDFLESLRRTVGILNRLPAEPVPDEIRRRIRDSVESFRRARGK
jgi:RNA polymerase sigma-70 factor (ECF subfamily)